MIIRIKENVYRVTKIESKRDFRMLVSSDGLHIEFRRATCVDGWKSIHDKATDPMFPENDVWEILKLLDFIYLMKNQNN